MRRFSEDAVRRVGRLIFEAAGCSPADALTVVDHLVESCLFGHDSHGSLRVYEYIDQILAGTFDPKGIPRLERQKGVTACIDGDGTRVEGRDCVMDPDFQDGWSAGFELTAVRVNLVAP